MSILLNEVLGDWQLRCSDAALSLAKRLATGLGSVPNPTMNLAGIPDEQLHVPPIVFSLCCKVFRSVTKSPHSAIHSRKLRLRPLGNTSVSLTIQHSV